MSSAPQTVVMIPLVPPSQERLEAYDREIERRASNRNRPMQLFRLRNMAARRVVRRGNVVRSWRELQHPLPGDIWLAGDWYMLYRQAVTLYSRLVTLAR